ncbi:MAG TPA: hypothetical protein VGK73_10330 [Polyangiaceae bacterium]
MLVSSPFVRPWPAFLVGLAWSGALLGCQRKDPEKCTEAQQVVRKSIDARDFAAARQWREYAYKQCDDPALLAGLDKEIVDREAAIQAEAQAAEKKKAATQQLVNLFLAFTAENRAAPDRASATPACDPPPPGAPAPKPGEESKERFCTAIRQTGTGQTLQARYWQSDPAAFRFTTTPDEPLDCSSVGGTVGKKWEVPAQGGKSAIRWRCDLSGALQGLTAVVSGAAKAELHIISPTYVSRDPGWKAILEGP